MFQRLGGREDSRAIESRACDFERLVRASDTLGLGGFCRVVEDLTVFFCLLFFTGKLCCTTSVFARRPMGAPAGRHNQRLKQAETEMVSPGPRKMDIDLEP